MRFHTCILKGPIPFMTHSSLLISSVKRWSRQNPQNYANPPKSPKLQSASIPSKCRSTVSSLKRSILKSHHLKISEVRLFLRNFFLRPQDPKIDQKLPPKIKLRQNRGVPGPIGLQPACGSQRCQPARTWKGALNFPRGDVRIPLWKPKETISFFNAHTRLIEMTSGPYDGYSYWIKKARRRQERCLHMKAHRGQQANAPPTRNTFVLQGSYKAR